MVCLRGIVAARALAGLDLGGIWVCGLAGLPSALGPLAHLYFKGMAPGIIGRWPGHAIAVPWKLAGAEHHVRMPETDVYGNVYKTPTSIPRKDVFLHPKIRFRPR